MSEKITFYKDQWSFVQELSYEEAGLLFKAAFEYSMGVPSEKVGETYFQDCDRFLITAWRQTREKLDFNMKKELERSQKAKASVKARWEKERSTNEYERKERNTNVYERIRKDAVADSSIPTNNILLTTDNNKHAVGKNGKTYRILDDGIAYHWDDNTPVEEGENVG